MELTCTLCGADFPLMQEEIAWYEKFKAEPQPLCFWCLQKRHLCFRNGRKLYKRHCDHSGEEIVSMYAPSAPFPVYKADVWWSDTWDPCAFGRDVDFSRPFFDQLLDLIRDVPHLALANVNPSNSPYCNMCDGNRNCYLVLGGDYNEDCLYSVFGMRNKTCIDCDTANDNEQSYSCLNTFDSYGCRFAFDCKNCTDCAFVSDCTGCTECILCTNLAKQSYCIRNQQFSKEEYMEQKRQLLRGSYAQQQNNWREFLSLLEQRIVKYAHIVSCQDCTGDYIKGSKNCTNCFDTWDCEDMMHVILADTMKDGFRSNCVGHQCELCYDIQSAIRAYDCRHSFAVFDTKYAEYSESIYGSEYIFGCSSLHKKKYCILNKQYSEEEFGDVRAKTIEYMKSTGEWGEFLPTHLSCFGYNESTAYEFFPLTKEEALAQGFKWRDEPEEQLDVERVIPADQLPDNIADIPDDILNWAVRCEQSGRPFKVIKPELAFYRTHKIPVPRLHPDERYVLRLSLKNPYRLWDRECQKCGVAISTSYAPERSERVYCEKCYLEEVY